jgi:poly(3-hydroxybutyrate) depolymerase
VRRPPILSRAAQFLQPPMVYHLHELQRMMVEPLSELAAGSSKALRHPSNPFRWFPNVRTLAASQALFHRLTKRYDKPSWDITEVEAHGKTVSVVEEALMSEPFCRLLHFTRRTDDAELIKQLDKDPRILIVAPLSGHHATLLRDTVRTLLAHHDVYVTEWLDARDVPVSEGDFHLDDYVHTIMRYIRQLGAESLHVMAVCQPTVPVLAAVSLLAQGGEKTPRTLTLMGGPIDARKSPTEVNKLATEHPYSWFEKNMIHKVPGPYKGKGRAVYPGFFQLTAFVMMNPKNHFKAYWNYWIDSHKGERGAASRAAHEKFYDEYNSVLDMDAAYYLETVRVVFQDFALANGTWDIRGVRVNPSAIKETAIFTIEGEKDDISGLGQTAAAHDLCPNVPAEQHKHLVVQGAGHYGIFSGHRWREHTYPVLREFILAHG